MVTIKSCICGKDVGDKECFQKSGGKRRYSLLRKMEKVGDLTTDFRQIGYEKIS